ncbi:MAG: hypothetical protein AB3N23_03375 [Paracoccaceae bacterium]
MKPIFLASLMVLLCACSAPHFVGDAPPVPVTSKTPAKFDLPARFAFARVVYGDVQSPGAEEKALWEDLAGRTRGFGSVTQLVQTQTYGYRSSPEAMIEDARAQRFNYLLVVTFRPETGSADIVLFHVASGGAMVTGSATSPAGGRRGFWGGRIRNPTRLEHVTLRIARVAVPAVEDILRGVAERQR